MMSEDRLKLSVYKKKEEFYFEKKVIFKNQSLFTKWNINALKYKQ